MTTKLSMLAAAVVICVGCAKHEAAPVAAAAQTFATPEEAVAALVAAVEQEDIAKLKTLLGPGAEKILESGDPVADKRDRETFLTRYRTKHTLAAGGPSDMVLQVGEDDWPLPIPLVQRDKGWSFDGAAGADEILMRRIGANELNTIDLMRGFVAAQYEYADEGHDGAESGVYAQKLRSTPVKHDGLYWQTTSAEPPSPAGPFLAEATAEGYKDIKGAPYHGYRYRILTAQGASANGGKRDYLVSGKLTGGFALLAWPDQYAVSGITSFLVNQDGVVWQRDLGDQTPDLVASIQAFDPDQNWTPIAPEAE